MGGDVLSIDVEERHAVRAAQAVGGRAEEGGRISLDVGDGGAAVPRALATLGALGTESRSVALTSPTLDDVFLRVAGERINPTDHAFAEVAA